MSRPNYPNGFSDGALIRELLTYDVLPRKIFYVGNNSTLLPGEKGASDSNSAGTFLRPFSTLDYAVGQTAAGDVIAVRPGHTTTVSAAAGLDLDVAGITIVFLGNGTNRGTITFGTAVGADMDVDAANITLINPRFTAALDALTGPIDVNSANFRMFNATWEDGTTINTTDCVVADANADDMLIDGFKFIDGDAAGTQKQSFIQVAAASRPVLKNIVCTGDYGTGIIENGTAWVDALLEHCALDNAAAGPVVAILLQATSSGQMRFCHLRVASGTTYLTAANDMQFYECFGTGTDATAGEKIGTLLAGDIEAKIDVIDEFHDVPAADNVLNAQINEVIGNKTDATPTGAVTATDTLMGYTKQLVTELQVVDEFMDVPAADNVLNAQMNEVLGNKTDATPTGAVTTTDTLMGYAKQLVTELQVVDEFMDVPAADNALNAQMNEVLGNKSDATPTGAVTTTDTLMGYAKQLVTELQVVDEYHDVPAADNVLNAQINEVIGNKSDAAADGPVTTTDTLVGYAKQLIVQSEGIVTSSTAVLATAIKFTVTGWIKIEALVSECMATGDGGAATLQWTADPTVGAAGTISGATGSLATAVTGSSITLAGTALATVPLFSVTGANLIANPGTVVIPPGTIETIAGGAASTATWRHILRYKRLTVGATVT